MEFHCMLPVFLDPAATENREGFNHLTDLRGAVEEATATYIIRNHDKTRFEEQKSRFLSIRDYLNGLYGYQAVKVDVHDTYYNMFEILKDRMDIIELAENAIRDAGLEPFSEPIRGGTDGARLTFDGLPCPNLGTGGYQFHGRYEFASVQQMEKAVDILKNIVRRAAGETPR
jgi:tripeptide aminopeptidase